MIAELIARDSITLVRDEEGFLPLDRRSPMLMVWPHPIEGRIDPFVGYASKLATHRMPLDPSDDDIGAAVLAASSYPCVVVGTYDARYHPKQQELVRALSATDVDLIVVGIQSPYDLLCYPEISCYLATYGAQDVSLDALARVIFGLEMPRGKLPIALPNLYPVGHGLLDFNGKKGRKSNAQEL
jgi:beta-N-acetylhexosaminidase